MPWPVPWVVPTPDGDFCFSTGRPDDDGASAAEAAACARAIRCVQSMLELREPGAVQAVEALYSALENVPRRTGGAWHSELELQRLAEWLGQAIRGGRVRVAKQGPLRYRTRTETAVSPALRPQESPEEALSDFEITVLDEVGEPLSGIELEFSSGLRREILPTDGSGKAKWRQIPSGFATVKFRSEDKVREALHKRWGTPRNKPWYRPPAGKEEQHTILAVRRSQELAGATLTAGEPHTLVLTPWVLQARLFGLCFDTSKCFLLPSARGSLVRLKELYEKNPDTDLLVVGHTDRAGTPSHNDPLSLERAEAMVAFLQDKVDAWYAWYGSSKPADKRWGHREDELMIEGIAEDKGETLPVDRTPVEWYQETRGLQVDNIAGEQTRKALIKEYMSLDDTTLPEGIKIVAHGCGENFPVTAAADGTAAQEDRRVEMFFFDNAYYRTQPRAEAVLPPPPGKNSPPGSTAYPEWVKRAQELHDLRVGAWLRLVLRYEDGTLGKNIPVKLKLSDGTEPSGITNDRGILMVHVPQLESWEIAEIQDFSEVVSLV